MNYIVNGKYYIANDGYLFRSKDTGIISKTLRLKNPSLFNDYEAVKVFIAPDGKEYKNKDTRETSKEVYISDNETIDKYELIDIEYPESV